MKILLTGAYKYTEGQLSRLKALGADFLYVEDEREELSFDVSAVDAVVCNGLFLYNDIKKFKNLKFEKVKQKMPCFFNKLFCVILCILGSTKRPPAKVPPVAYALSCYFRVLCVRFSLKYERTVAARPPPPSTRPAPCSHSARLKPSLGSCSSRFGFA